MTWRLETLSIPTSSQPARVAPVSAATICVHWVPATAPTARADHRFRLHGHLAGGDIGASLGDLGADDTSDRNGTGEHLTAGKEPDIRVGGDIAPDRIVGAEEAGLGGGLDQAEEAQLGVTDEELAARRKARTR